MRLNLHPHDRDRLNVELLLSTDEAEHWIARLQGAVRNAREGRGDQLLLLGEPARIVLTVQDRNLSPDEPPVSPYEAPAPAREFQQGYDLWLRRVMLWMLLALLLMALFRFKIFPLVILPR